jgi:hypothetical protein
VSPGFITRDWNSPFSQSILRNTSNSSSGFGLDRFSIYSGFGLDRFHCIRCLFLFVAFVLLVAVKLVNWPCLRRLSYSQIQVMIMSACNVTYDIEGWSIPYVCLIYRYSKVKDPCRIRFWWVPTKIRTSVHLFILTNKSKVIILTIDLTNTFQRY